MKTLVCIPVYDNERTIADVVRAALQLGHGVLVVDDGSRDRSAQNARDAGAVVESHPRNRGKGEALKTGFAYARAHGFTHLATIDGDGQHEVGDLPLLIAAAARVPEAIVLGVRDMLAIPPKNRFGNRFSNFWVNLAMRRRFADTQCGLRVYPVGIDDARYRGKGYEFETEALIRHARGGKPIVPIHVHVYYPIERVSHFKPWRDATSIVLLVMRFLFLPRMLWTLMLLVACAAPKQAARPLARSAEEEKARALSQTALPFTASQRLRFSDGETDRRAEALFVVYPGRGYRLRVLGPMMVTVFDVTVRCGRYAVETRGKPQSVGALAEADEKVGFFPVAAVERLLRPLGAGAWHGKKFVSEDGVHAYWEPGRELFSLLELGEAMKLRVRETARVDGVMVPKKVRIELEGRRTLDIENADIGFDVPAEADALAPVACGG